VKKTKLAIAALSFVALAGCAVDSGGQYMRRTYALNGSTAHPQANPYGSPYGYGTYGYAPPPEPQGEARRLRGENTELRRLVAELSTRVEELTGAVSQLLQRVNTYTPAAAPRAPTDAPRLTPVASTPPVAPGQITEDDVFEAAFSGGQLPVTRGATASSELPGRFMPAAFHPDRSATPVPSRRPVQAPMPMSLELSSTPAAVSSTRPVYDVVLKAGEGGEVKRLLRFFTEHGFKDIFAGSTTVYLGTYHTLSRADDRRKMIESTTGVQPEIVRRIVPRS
jgi:hypothetical protein